MTDATQTPPQQTLGQRIDAVLNPLYAEAEQHRASLEQAKAQIQALQQQVDTATQGLASIESRMAEVVRSLAEQDPVLAAVVGASAPEDAVHMPAEPAITEGPASTEQFSNPPADPPEPAEPGEPVPLDLDPETDQAMVDEATDLLAAEPAGAGAEPVPDIAAVAERAAATAQELQDKAAGGL